jgi:hypothetical protein
MRPHDPRSVQLSQLITLESNGAPPTEFCLLNAGETRTSKGTFRCDDAHAALCIAHEMMPADGLLPLDYDHGMVNVLGGEGKAAGWFKLANRNGALWATNVQYTPTAAKALRDREYRYYSPALWLDDTGYVTRIVNCALTCLPATIKQTPLAASELSGSRATAAVGLTLSADEARLCAQLRIAPHDFLAQKALVASENGEAPGSHPATLSADEARLCTQLRIAPHDFLTQKALVASAGAAQ